MIYNNRSVTINLSFKGKNIGIAAGQSKSLSHFFTPIEEMQLARQFNLIYIPEENLLKQAEEEKKKMHEERKALENISQKMIDEKKSTKQVIDIEVNNIIETNLGKFNEEESKKKSVLHEVSFQSDTFYEKEDMSGKELAKEKVQLLEEDNVVANDIEENKELEEEIHINKKQDKKVKKLNKKK